MSPAQELLAAAVVLYLVECGLWLRRELITFRARAAGGFRPASLANLPGAPTKALVFQNPLPPLGGVAVAEFWPIAFGRDGFAAGCIQHLDLPAGWDAPPQFMAYRDVRSVASQNDAIYVNDRVFAYAAGPRSAAHWARLIRQIVDAPPAARAGVVDDALRAAFDVEAAAARYAMVRGASAGVRIACNLLWLHLFAVAPLVGWTIGLSATWPPLLAALLPLWIAPLVLFRRAHRTLYPGANGERRLRLLLLAVTPVATIRATDALVRNAFVGFHPAAVAAVTCTPESFREFLHRLYLDLLHPPRVEPPGLADAGAAPHGSEAVQMVAESALLQAEAARAAMREKLLAHTRRLLESRGIDVAALTEPPAPEDERVRQFCPRCRGQYVVEHGVCGTCPGVTLQPIRQFAADATAFAHAAPAVGRQTLSDRPRVEP